MNRTRIRMSEVGGFPNIERVVTYPARLTEDGGVERIGPTEVVSETDPTWNQLDQDHWSAYRSDSDYKACACAHTAASISLPVSAKDSWEWRGSCCLVRVHRQARRCLFTPTWNEDIWHGASDEKDICDACWTEEAFRPCD